MPWGMQSAKVTRDDLEGGKLTLVLMLLKQELKDSRYIGQMIL